MWCLLIHNNLCCWDLIAIIKYCPICCQEKNCSKIVLKGGLIVTGLIYFPSRHSSPAVCPRSGDLVSLAGIAKRMRVALSMQIQDGWLFWVKTRKASKGNSGSPWSLHIGSFWKTHFINPPEVRGQVVSLKEMVGCDSRKIAQNRTGVKRDIAFLYVPTFKCKTSGGTICWGL